MNNNVYIFWDNSNIFIPAKEVSVQRGEILQDKYIRIQFNNLYQLAHGGRNVSYAICVGSVPPELENVWDRLRNTGIGVELYERGAESGKEQGVDQCLQIHMLRAAVDTDDPGIAVLLTGDGAGYEDGVGFHADLARMQRKGWAIEVISWDIACNKKLKAWAQNVGVYIPMEEYYESVTFVQNGRRSKNVTLNKRRYARR